MGEIYSFVRRTEDKRNDRDCREPFCMYRCSGIAEQLKVHRKRKENEALLEVLSGEASLLRKLMLMTEDDDRRDDYTRLVASVDGKRLVLSRQLEEDRR